MKKSKVFLLAAGIPLLYMAVQFAVMTAFTAYYYIRALAGNRFILSSGDSDEIMSFSMRVADEMLDNIIGVTIPVSIIACAVFMIILVAAYHKKPYRVWDAVGLTARSPVNTLGAAVSAGFFFNMMFTGLISLMPVPESWNSAHNATTEALFGGPILLSILFTALLAPLVEEIVFRGFTHRYLGKIYPPWVAALLSGAIFGIIHFNWLQTVYAFALGVILGFVCSWTKSLRPCVAFHMMFNAANFVISPVLILIFGENIEVVPAPAAGIMFIAGGVAAIYCMAFIYRNRQTSADSVFG